MPFGYTAAAPAYWRDEYEGLPGYVLGEEQCVINDEHFFVRGRIVLPVLDSDTDFEWGVWVSLSETNYDRMGEVWHDPDRVNEPPYFGWLSTELLVYEPSTLNLKTNLHTQEVGVRPTVELEPTDHPLAVEQRQGITLQRIQAITERVLHG
ncbi:hypothetical protein Lesp02_45960 [Lentzea sp. NBRC 105346]|nr:hypothetical protein Lesp02_45960 [Lentzea sp. NBRC 105346]